MLFQYLLTASESKHSHVFKNLLFSVNLKCSKLFLQWVPQGSEYSFCFAFSISEIHEHTHSMMQHLMNLSIFNSSHCLCCWSHLLCFNSHVQMQLMHQEILICQAQCSVSRWNITDRNCGLHIKLTFSSAEEKDYWFYIVRLLDLIESSGSVNTHSAERGDAINLVTFFSTYAMRVCIV